MSEPHPLYSCCVHCADDQPHIERDTHIVPCDQCQDTRLIQARALAWDEGFDAGWAARSPDDHAPNPYRTEAEL